MQICLKGFVCVCAFFLLLTIGCGDPPSQRIIDAFAKGDTGEAILLEAKIGAEEEDSQLAAFLVGLSRKCVEDVDIPSEPLAVEKPDQLAAALEIHRENASNSPWLNLAAGVLAEAGGDKSNAAEYYALARSNGGDQNDLFSRVLFAAEVAVSGAELKNTLEAEVDGVLRPAPGLHGYLLPLDGETTVKGELHSTIGETNFVATVEDWAYLYFGDEANAEPCGWGLSLRSGELLLTRETFERTRAESTTVVAEQGFTARSWDPLGRYVLITFPEGELRGFVAPVQIQWPDDAEEAHIKAIPTPGIGFSGRMYWAEGYEGSLGGMMIDGRGRRVMFNTEGLRVKLAAPSEVSGPAGAVSKRTSPSSGPSREPATEKAPLGSGSDTD